MTTHTALDLAKLVADVRDQGMIRNRDIVEEIIAQLDPADYEDALRQALPSFVQSILILNTNAMLRSASYNGHSSTTPTPTPSGSPRKIVHGHSPKNAQKKTWAQRFRTEYVAMWDGSRKQFDDLTIPDLRRLAEHQAKHIEGAVRKRDLYDALANELMLTKHKAVADLSDQFIERVVKNLYPTP